MMTYRAGDRVRLAEGFYAEVLGVLEEGLVLVRLDGETIGLYPAGRLAPAGIITTQEE